MIRVKLHPLGTVHAPFDAYGSKKLWKNQCVDSIPYSYIPYSYRDFFELINNKGFFLLQEILLFVFSLIPNLTRIE